MCVEHLKKITANDTHKHDHICDTLYDACKIALIDQTMYIDSVNDKTSETIKAMANTMRQRSAAINRTIMSEIMSQS